MGDVTQLLDRWNAGDAAGDAGTARAGVRRVAPDGRRLPEARTRRAHAAADGAGATSCTSASPSCGTCGSTAGGTSTARRPRPCGASSWTTRGSGGALKRGGADAVRVELDSLPVSAASSATRLRAPRPGADGTERVRPGEGPRRRTAVLRRPVDRGDRRGARDLAGHRQAALGLRRGRGCSANSRAATDPG